MSPEELTLRVLKDIRSEAKKTNERIDQSNVRLDQTNARLDSLREELSRRIVDSEVRTATAIADLGGTFREMVAYLRSVLDLRPRVETCERDIAGIKGRLA